jgi:homocysteine S-methyltransferase
MTPTELRGRLSSEVLLCDGAMGTMLHAAGNSLDQSLPALNISHPSLVRAIHDSYVEAGVDIVQTNTFGAGRLRLGEYGLADRTAEVNRAGVRIAREATRGKRPVLVAGSVSPAVGVHQRWRISSGERVEAVREQISMLVDAGVDIVLLETFGFLNELVEAVQTAGEVCGATIPVIAQASFGADGRTLCGHTPHDVVSALAGAPIVALGTNCILGPQRSLAVFRELRSHTDIPLTVQPNAGLPRRIAPARFEYDIDAEYLVHYTRLLIEAGAAVVGGCCGTTPTQLAAVARAVAEHRHGTDERGAAMTHPVVADPVDSRSAPIPLPDPCDAVVEITPDLGNGIDESVELARKLGDIGVGVVAVAAEHRSRAGVNAIDLAVHLRQLLGLETMASVTTWDHTIMALQADLLGAHALGMRRIVCETGRPPAVGDYPHVDGIWDVDSIGLIRLLAALNSGIDLHGLRLATKTCFSIGARINPGSHDIAHAGARARQKIAAGAHFLITRPIYELTGLERLLDKLGDHDVPIFVAIRPLTGFDEAEYLANEVPDVTIPATSMAALTRAGNDARQAGMELAAELATQARHLATGVLIVPGADPVGTVRHLLGS